MSRGARGEGKARKVEATCHLSRTYRISVEEAVIGEDRGGVTWLHERHKGRGGARHRSSPPVAQWKRSSAGTFNNGKCVLHSGKLLRLVCSGER